MTSETKLEPEVDEFSGMGEVPPLLTDVIPEVAHEEWNARVDSMEERLPEDHEPATFIDGRIVRARSMAIKAIRGTKTYAVDIIEEPGSHKTEIATATVLTVAGLLMATHMLHPRKKE